MRVPGPMRALSAMRAPGATTGGGSDASSADHLPGQIQRRCRVKQSEAIVHYLRQRGIVVPRPDPRLQQRRCDGRVVGKLGRPRFQRGPLTVGVVQARCDQMLDRQMHPPMRTIPGHLRQRRLGLGDMAGARQCLRQRDDNALTPAQPRHVALAQIGNQPFGPMAGNMEMKQPAQHCQVQRHLVDKGRGAQQRAAFIGKPAMHQKIQPLGQRGRGATQPSFALAYPIAADQVPRARAYRQAAPFQQHKPFFGLQPSAPAISSGPVRQRRVQHGRIVQALNHGKKLAP